MYQPFQIGDIRIKPYLMDHSSFDAEAFEIQAGGKTLIHSGDFRGHGRMPVYLNAFLCYATRQDEMACLLRYKKIRVRTSPDSNSECHLYQACVWTFVWYRAVNWLMAMSTDALLASSDHLACNRTENRTLSLIEESGQSVPLMKSSFAMASLWMQIPFDNVTPK